MTEQLIWCETAKLAKKKGFKNGSYAYYSNGDELTNNLVTISTNPHNILEFFMHTNNFMQRFRYEAPTQSLLHKWLREEHNLNPTVSKLRFTNLWKCYLETEVWKGVDENSIYTWWSTDQDTYEKALELGLIKALTLIQ